MEDISKPSLSRKRKLITKAAERFTPFNKIRKSYLPKRPVNKQDIRGYFISSTVDHSNFDAFNVLSNGENTTAKNNDNHKFCMQLDSHTQSFYRIYKAMILMFCPV